MNRLAMILAITFAACTGSSPGADDHHAFFVRWAACSEAEISTVQATIARDPSVFWALPLNEPRFNECAARAGSCAAFNACYGVTVGECEAGHSPGCDDATHARTCGFGGVQEIVDCSVQPDGNNHCIDGDLGARCGVQACSDEGALRCSDEHTLAACVWGGVEVHLACDSGQTCAADPASGRAACVETVERCTASRCQGTSLLLCDESGVGFHNIDCSALAGAGASCLSGSSPSCAPASVTCTTQQSHCDGNVIRLCTCGSFESFDCGAFGATCVEVPGAAGTFLDCQLP